MKSQLENLLDAAKKAKEEQEKLVEMLRKIASLKEENEIRTEILNEKLEKKNVK